MNDDADGFTQAAFRFCPGCHAHCFPNSRRVSLRGGRAFSSRESPFASRQENVLILILRANSGANLNSLLADGAARGFRRLFAGAQSTTASKLPNPLMNQRFLVLQRRPGTPPPTRHDLPGLTAEIMTKACAIGQSSVMLRSIRASWPGGISASSCASAPPVSCMVGRPPGRFTTPISRHQTPLRIPVPSALEQASLAANRLAQVATT